MIKVRVRYSAYPGREARWISFSDHWYGYIYRWGFVATIKISKCHTTTTKQG